MSTTPKFQHVTMDNAIKTGFSYLLSVTYCISSVINSVGILLCDKLCGGFWERIARCWSLNGPYANFYFLSCLSTVFLGSLHDEKNIYKNIKTPEKSVENSSPQYKTYINLSFDTTNLQRCGSHHYANLLQLKFIAVVPFVPLDEYFCQTANNFP